MHSENCFVTLTYNPESLPRGPTLVKRHVQLFIKQVRRYLETHGIPKRIRYFAAGEYGKQDGRPHYHIILFGWMPKDGEPWLRKDYGSTYKGGTLERLWGRGYVEYAEMGAGAASYTAKYTVEKITGDAAKKAYERVTEDGEVVDVIPEFSMMSNRPGIGATFYEKYEDDFRNHDYTIASGKKKKVPRYYDKLYERKNPKRLESIKDARRIKAKKHRANNTPERLLARETVAKAKLKFNQQRKIGL